LLSQTLAHWEVAQCQLAKVLEKGAVQQGICSTPSP